MKWTEYFKIQLKKPEENSEIKTLRESKKTFEDNLSKCYSRLETIEICTSNSKIEDASLLASALYLDIYNMLLQYCGLERVLQVETESEISRKINQPQILNVFLNLSKNIKLNDISEENVLNLESILSETLYKLEKEASNTFENPIDNYKKRLIFQSIIFSIILLLVSGSLVKKYIESRPLNEDFSSINTSEDKTVPLVPESELSLPVHPEKGWETLKFTFPQPRNIEFIQFNPLHQNKARIQIKDFKVYDEKGNILYQKDFLVNNLDLTQFLKSIHSDEIVPGKIVIGRAIEMESTGNTPRIYFTFEKKIEKVSYIEMSIRSTKRVNKYQD